MFLKVLPENESWILPGLRSIHLVGSIVLGHGDLHELGHVEGEGEDGDGDDVDQEPSRVRHRQADRTVLVGPAHGDVSKTFQVWVRSSRPLEHTFSYQVSKLDKRGYSDEGR